MGTEKAGKESHLAEIAFASRASVVGEPKLLILPSGIRLLEVRCHRSISGLFGAAESSAWEEGSGGPRGLLENSRRDCISYISGFRTWICLDKERLKNLGKFQQLPSKILLVT